MKIKELDIQGPLIIETNVFPDQRGCFYESFNIKKLSELGINANFVQDNVSKSKKGVVRGLHYQLDPFSQAKLIIVLSGKILDVIVDVRKGSPTFGKHVSVELASKDHKVFFIPKGFAHGFIALEADTIVQYKCDEYYSPKHERGINILDPTLNIDWNYPKDKIIIADRDLQFPLFDKAEMNFIYEA
jgi:dTDP-4-dehydrorhamnose 3,5-epimerase